MCMKAETQRAQELDLAMPLSPHIIGASVFANPDSLKCLAVAAEVKPWQLAFFTGWESFMRQADKRAAYLRLQPYKAIVAPKLRPKSGGDRLSFKESKLNRIFTRPTLFELSRRRHTVYSALALLGLFMVALVLLLAIHTAR